MDLLNLIVGLFMIGMGFLVKSNPDLISGYNTMPKEKKKHVDIKGLSTYMRNGFIAIGLTIIIGYFLFKWLGFSMIANAMILIVILAGVTIMLINAGRFDHNKEKKTKPAYFITGLVAAFVIGLMVYGFIPSKFVMTNDSIQFTGMYGPDIKISEISSVYLTDSIPHIKIRTNGFSFGEIRKGSFILDEYGKSHLLIHSDKPPYLIIIKNNGEKTIINFKDKYKTETIFSRIKTLLAK